MAMDVAAAGAGKKGRGIPEMNVTPLVDVVLVLLIIFMVLTPLLAKQFWVHLPNKPKDETEAQAANDAKPIVVSVTQEGEFRINKDVVRDSEFAPKLRRVLAARGERKIFFDASSDADFGRAVEALDLAREGGASTIAVMTQPLE